jgi:ribosomal protein L24
MTKLKIGDKVKILIGDQKGKIGTISAFFQKPLSIKNKKNQAKKNIDEKKYVYIQEIPPRLKYIKKNSNEKQEGVQKKEIPLAIHISNISLWSINNINPNLEKK